MSLEGISLEKMRELLKKAKTLADLVNFGLIDPVKAARDRSQEGLPNMTSEYIMLAGDKISEEEAEVLMKNAFANRGKN